MALSPSQMLLAVRNDLESWDAGTGVILSMATDPFHVLELLAETSKQVRVILLWAGDEAQFEGETQLGIAINRFEVTVSHPIGLSNRPGEHLHSSAGAARPALAELVHRLRARIRSLRFPADETTSEWLEYERCEPVTMPEGFRIAAYTLHFRIHAALGEDPARDALIS